MLFSLLSEFTYVVYDLALTLWRRIFNKWIFHLRPFCFLGFAGDNCACLYISIRKILIKSSLLGFTRLWNNRVSIRVNLTSGMLIKSFFNLFKFFFLLLTNMRFMHFKHIFSVVLLPLKQSNSFLSFDSLLFLSFLLLSNSIFKEFSLE